MLNLGTKQNKKTTFFLIAILQNSLCGERVKRENSIPLIPLFIVLIFMKFSFVTVSALYISGSTVLNLRPKEYGMSTG